MYEAIKSLGQNFLNDHNMSRMMIAALSLKSGDEIIEIGPGLGVLTEELAQKMGDMSFKVTAVEIDDRFIPKLLNMFTFYPDIRVVQADILEWLPLYKSEKPFKILGSLPYYISSPIIHEIVQMPSQPETAVLMLQKEVAEKITHDAPDASYLSVFVQTFFDVEYLMTVPRTSFDPAPTVDSAVIILRSKHLALSLERIRKFSGFLHKGFASPRKMLNKQFKPEELATVGIDPTLRAEAVSAKVWFEFFNALVQD